MFFDILQTVLLGVITYLLYKNSGKVFVVKTQEPEKKKDERVVL